MYIEYNPNPEGKNTDDCTIRAISKALDIDWDTAYVLLAYAGLMHRDMMHKNYVWGSLLEEHGFHRVSIPDTCPQCYSVRQFAADNPRGLFVLGTGSHVVTVKDGAWYDMWDSGGEVPIIVYWRNDDGI